MTLICARCRKPVDMTADNSWRYLCLLDLSDKHDEYCLCGNCVEDLKRFLSGKENSDAD